MHLTIVMPKYYLMISKILISTFNWFYFGDECVKILPFDLGVFFKSLNSDGFDADDGLFKYFDTVPLRFFKCLLGECNGNLIGVLIGVDFALFLPGD